MLESIFYNGYMFRPKDNFIEVYEYLYDINRDSFVWVLTDEIYTHEDIETYDKKSDIRTISQIQFDKGIPHAEAV